MLQTLDPFGGSYTWFEIAVGRDGIVLPLTIDIQHNRRGKLGNGFRLPGMLLICPLPLRSRTIPANRNVQHYDHDLPLESPVLQQARKGDCLLLLAKARYAVSMRDSWMLLGSSWHSAAVQGWQNIVQ